MGAGVELVRGGALKRRWWAMVLFCRCANQRIRRAWHRQLCSFGYPHLEEAYRVGELLFPHLDVAIPEIPSRSR